MIPAKSPPSARTTTAIHLAGLLALMLLVQSACSSRTTLPIEPAREEENLARTEFTSRMENFFEYEPLKAGKASQFLIHLTDLSDGAPVEKAEVTMTIRAKGSDAESGKTTARVGKVTGIYVADVTIAKPGEYDIEIRVRNATLDERLPLKDFKVE